MRRGDARPRDGDGDLVAITDIGADELPASAAPSTLMRADLADLVPRTPDLSLIFPFAPTNPLTPVIRDPFASGDTDPTPGILTNDTIPLAIYAVDPEPTGDLLAVADTAGDTVRITIR